MRNKTKTPVKVQSENKGSSIMGDIASTVVTGAALGTGQAIAHKTVDAVVNAMTTTTTSTPDNTEMCKRLYELCQTNESLCKDFRDFCKK